MNIFNLARINSAVSDRYPVIKDVLDNGVPKTKRSLVSKILNAITGTGGAVEEWTLGIDTSHWNGAMNWSVAKNKGVKWMIGKVSDVGSVTHKPFYDAAVNDNYFGAKEAGVLTGGYCWLDPGFDPIMQAEYFLEWHRTHPIDLPPAVDFEDGNFTNGNDFLYKLQKWLEIVELETQRKPIIYTAEWFMSKFDRSKTSWMGEYSPWIAQYIQRTHPSAVPREWNDWKIWQYNSIGHYPYFNWAERNIARGREWGSSSGSLDMNWFKGTMEDLLAFCNMEEEPTPPEEEILFEAVCKTNVLNVRKGPSKTYSVVGYLYNGNRVNVYEEQNGWYRIQPNKWVSATYMERIGEPPVVIPPPSVPGVLFYPVNEGEHYITQYFGERPNIYVTSRGHNGVDFGTIVGSNVYAMQDGVVIFSEDVKQKVNYGRHIRIQHENGVSIYGHLSRRYVEVGETVHAKQLIGLTGGAVDDPYSGYSTGPHLHAEFRMNNPADAPQIPGGFVYGAIDLMKEFASHSYDGNDPEVLFQAQCLVTELNTRYGASIHSYRNGKIPYGKVVTVYEEKDGWYKISPKAMVWCSANPIYMQRLNHTPPEGVLFQAKCTANSLYKRAGAGTEYPTIGYLVKNDIVDVFEINGIWYRIGDAWVSSNYMERIQN